MRTGDDMIKTIFVAGLLSATLSIAGWPGTVLAETKSEEPTLKQASERKAQLSQIGKPLAGVPDDEFGRGTPRTSLLGFAKATLERDFERASRYLDLTQLPTGLEEGDGPRLARQLRIAVGRQLWVDFEAISISPEGDVNDGLPESRDRIGWIAGAKKSFDIVLQRVPREDGVLIWKFAPSTVADIPQLYEEFGFSRLETVLPSWFFDYRIIGIEIVFWAILLLTAVAVLPVAMMITTGLMWVLRRFRADLAPEVERFFAGPIQLLMWVLLGRSAMQMMHTSVMFEAAARARTVLVVALAWVVLRAMDFGGQRIMTRLEAVGLSNAKVILRPVARLLKLAVVVGAGLLWVENLGYEITTMIAGISISGVAIALASQKTLENVFGAVTLYTAQPVRVGDFCRFGGQLGTVEEIGLRATQIRTLDRSVVSIPNGEFATMHLDNLSRRDRFWYHPRIRLRLETTPDQIRYFLVEVRKMLYAHPKVVSEPLHVRFDGFGETALDVDVFAYIGVTNYSESLEIKEDLNLRIMDIFADAGIELAVPLQYEVEWKPLNPERVQEVQARVKQWRDQQTLYLPNFPPEKIAELKGSLDYPVAGSPGHR
jgi:MscS family membrane protein